MGSEPEVNSDLRRALEFMTELDRRHTYYVVGHHRADALMVTVVIPGERWEVEFLEDGSIEIERFVSSGEIGGEELLEELWLRTDE